jgi:acetyl-CoA synthetase
VLQGVAFLIGELTVKIWYPPKDVVNEANITHLMEDLGFKDYKSFVGWSTGDGWREFWRKAPEWIGVEWFKEPKEVVDLSQGPEWARWYRGGLLNAAYNVVDKPIREGRGPEIAFEWEGEDGTIRRYTYSEVKAEVDRFANYLREIGVKPKDVVMLYAPMLPETVFVMLATLKIGAVFSPVFSGFAPPAVAIRISSAEPKVFVTADGYYRRGKIIRLKELADEALRLSGHNVESVVVIRRLGIEVPWNDERDIYYEKAVAGKRPSCEAYEADPEDPALLLYTSGTTGKPKGAVISHAGTLLKPSLEHWINLDMKPGAKLLWITDIGWMMGPWQIIGAQFVGASHVMIEGAIDYPKKDRIWDLIERLRVTHLGFAATVARMLKTLDPEPLESHDLSSLKAFGNTGEPIDPDTWIWVMDKVGEWKRPMINLSGGTEIFGCILLPSPVVPLKPSTLWGPAPGVDADVFNDEGKSVRGGVGYLVIKKPEPSMTRGLWREPERYIRTYWSRFPGVWYHGDWAYIDEDGFWYILGRADDVIKVAGKRIGPAEIESIINEHPMVAESACIGYPHKVKGEVILCLTKLKEKGKKETEIEEEIKDLVSKNLGKPFKPWRVLVVNDLPRTRSGKIMRRVIKALAIGSDIGDISVLENPESIEEIKEVLNKLKEES